MVKHRVLVQCLILKSIAATEDLIEELKNQNDELRAEMYDLMD